MVDPESRPGPLPAQYQAYGPPAQPGPMPPQYGPVVPYSPGVPYPPGPVHYGQVALNPAAPYGVDPVTGLAMSDKSKVTAGLLQLFLPGFAVGRFYTGHIGLAVGQLAVGWTVFLLMGCMGFFVLGVTWLVSWVGFLWPVIDGIVLLAGRQTDAQGRLLR